MTRWAYTVTVTSDSQDKIRKALQQMQGTADLSKVAALYDELAEDADSDDPKEKRRLRILKVAIDLFVRHGYRRTSIDEVARGAHVAKGTVYLHFKSKADLLVGAITHEKMSYAARIRPLLVADLPPVTKLKLWLNIALRMTAQTPLLARLLSGDKELLAVLDDMDEVLGVRTTEMQLVFISSLIDQATSPHSWTPDEVGERARVLLSLVYLAGNFGDDRSRFGLPLDRHAELLADILVEGIGVEAAHSGDSDPGGEP